MSASIPNALPQTKGLQELYRFWQLFQWIPHFVVNGYTDMQKVRFCLIDWSTVGKWRMRGGTLFSYTISVPEDRPKIEFTRLPNRLTGPGAGAAPDCRRLLLALAASASVLSDSASNAHLVGTCKHKI